MRLAGIPVFLYLAFNSSDGRDTAAAILFWFIAAGDYFDGFVARATGQYSRMGAILDPIVDRLTVLSGAVVCWHFHLLPRWAIVVLAVRELVTLVLAEVALRNGLELEINWLGRIAVFNIMGGIFFSMLSDSVVWDVVFVFGVVCAILSTMIYARTGLAHMRATRPA